MKDKKEVVMDLAKGIKADALAAFFADPKHQEAFEKWKAEKTK